MYLKKSGMFFACEFTRIISYLVYNTLIEKLSHFLVFNALVIRGDMRYNTRLFKYFKSNGSIFYYNLL